MSALELKQLPEYNDWTEVKLLNDYAVFMGYISMAIKGLGYLVLTWTTVVLLGGFVSILHMKDLWCLTFITLVQIIGLFDVAIPSTNEKLASLIAIFLALMKLNSFGLMGGPVSLLPSHARLFLGYFLFAVQALVFAIVFFLLVTIYLFGIVMSGGISLWRLIEHDYRGTLGGEASNLIPALDTLYYLALLQGVLFCYTSIFGRAVKVLAETVAPKGGKLQLGVLHNYLQETKRGCEKDPSFAKGRNLVTCAVDMIASSSPLDCISGVEMLWTATSIARHNVQTTESKKEYDINILYGQRMLIKHLLLSSASSKHTLQKLLESLDSRGLHDTNTRFLTAKMVESIWCDINLEEFPKAIHHISSMIGTFEEFCIAEPYQREYLLQQYEVSWDLCARLLPPSPDPHSLLHTLYIFVLVRGLHMLRRLAAHKNNCRVIADTPDLVTKIMAPVTSDLLHNSTDDHDEWSEVVEESMEVMNELATAPGETGAKLRREISSCQGAMSTLCRILNCDDCSEELKISAIPILKHLYMDTQTSSREDLVLKQESREDFVRMLVNIFTHDNKFSSIRRCAGEALSVLCCHGGINNGTTVIQTGGGVVIDSLMKVLVQDKDTACRRSAAIILEHLCSHYTKDDEYLGKLKKSIPKLIREMLGILCSGDDTNTTIESDQNESANPKNFFF